MSAITVTGLYTYPIKSCHGIALSAADVTPRGLVHDRDYMVVDEHGAFLSQRQIPEMALIVPSLAPAAIRLSAPGMAPAEIPLALEADDTRLVHATVHGQPVLGQVVSEALNDWFSAYLTAYKRRRRYRLLRVREDAPRCIPERYRRPGASNQVGFADAHAILLASTASLAQLNTELDAPVPMSRFRPNLVVDGPGLDAYDEDYWSELSVGAMGAHVVKACDRCAIPDVDQETARRGKAVRRALVSRRGANAHDPNDTGVFFAQNIVHDHRPGLHLRVGDRVVVHERAAEPNVVLRRR